VLEKIPFNLLDISGKSLSDIVNVESAIYFYLKEQPSFILNFSTIILSTWNYHASVNVQLDRMYCLYLIDSKTLTNEYSPLAKIEFQTQKRVVPFTEAFKALQAKIYVSF